MDSHDAVIAPWATELLHFWFAQVGEAGWWSHDPAIDRLCAERWRSTWADKRGQPAERFLDRADEALAAILLFDQLPRNMFRGSAQAFDTDPLARTIARGALAHGYDVQIGGAGRHFFYMPFQHSEAIEDQDLAVTLFEGLGDDRSLQFARRHREIIRRHGRFPHRNAVLGRATRAQEHEALIEARHW